MTKPTPESNENNLAQQFAQSLIQYAPLGGNLFIFGSFAWSKSLLETGIAAILLIPTTIWAKFSEGFIEEFGVASNNWGKNTGKALTQALELSVLQRLAKLEDKYIRAQGMKCADLEVDGFQFSDLDCVPLLEQIFVPLKLHRNTFTDGLGEERFNQQGYGQAWQESDPSRIYSIWEFLKQRKSKKAHRLAIKANGGTGKTTLMRHIAYAFMSGEYKRQKGYRVPKLLPVLIYLRNAHKFLNSNEGVDLPALIHGYHLPSLSKRKGAKFQAQFSVEWIDLQLRRGKMLVMFDGFDEVKKDQRREVSRWIGEQMQEYPASIFLVTSRPKAYNQDFVAKQRCNFTVAVDKFSEEQQKEFIGNWYRAQEIKVRRGRKTDNVLDLAQENADNLWQQLEKRPELQDLAENPLMLNIMVTVHRRGQQLPERKAELYQRIFSLQLGTRITERGLSLMLSAADSQRILQGVAYQMFLTGVGTQIDQPSLFALLKESLSLAEELDEPENFALEDWLFQLEHRSELIVKRDDLYEFSHKSFQEFLAAKHVKEHKKEAELIEAWRNDPEWENTVLLYATLVNPTGLIETLFDSGDEKDRIMASKCLEITPRKVPERLREKLKNLDKLNVDLRYQKLESLLEKQDFKAADQETYRVMCEVIGEEKGYWFEPDDLRNFPCPDLKIIDSLWVKYSEGKFGFSVQKEIWEACGSPMTYNSDWEKFGDRIGWRVDTNWLGYEDLHWGSDNPHRGHLPVVSLFKFSVFLSRVSHYAISSLACRLVDCRMGGGGDDF